MKGSGKGVDVVNYALQFVGNFMSILDFRYHIARLLYAVLVRMLLIKNGSLETLYATQVMSVYTMVTA